MNVIVGIIVVLGIVVGFALLVSVPAMWLWNWLMPDIFGLMKLTWLQMLGLLVLCGFLFKSSNSTSKS